jgi:hypothetical protein
MFLLLCTLLLVVFTTHLWFPVIKDFSLFYRVRRQKFNWVTGYYSIKGKGKYYRHLVPTKDGTHWETEDGECRCKPYGMDEVSSDQNGNVLVGRVYFHNRMNTLV